MQRIAICVSEMSWIHWLVDSQIHRSCIVIQFVPSELLNVAIALFSKEKNKAKQMKSEFE